MLEYSSGNPKAIRAQSRWSLRRCWAWIAEGFPELYANLFRPQFRCSKLKERIQLKFIVILQFSCSESIQQLNNRSTQIFFSLNSFILLYEQINRRGRQPALLCHSHCHSLRFLEKLAVYKNISLFCLNYWPKKSFLPRLLYFVTVSCFQLSLLIISESICFVSCKKVGLPIKFSKKHALRLPGTFPKKFAQLIAHFIPFCKVEFFETSVRSEQKTD